MTDWSKLKVVDLKAELKSRGLSYAGLKGDLIARLVAADEETAQQGEENPEQDEKLQEPELEPKEQPEAPTEPATAEAENVEAKSEPVAVRPPSPVRERDPSPEEKIEDKIEDKIDAGQATQPTQQEEERIEPPVVAEPESKPEPAAPVAEIPSQSTTADDGQGGEAATDSLLPTGEIPTPLEQVTPSTSPNPEEQPAEQASIEPTPEAQKRKRRSQSPLPSEGDIARKRARSDNTPNGDGAHATGETNEVDIDMTSAGASDITPQVVEKSESDTKVIADSRKASLSPVADAPPVEMDIERSVEPAVHAPTAALYISNLMRPLRHADIQDHLGSLASTSHTDLGQDRIVKFFLDQIRTHAFVIFDTESSASRVRAALHNCVWPNESNRKALSVDYVPPEKVDEWIGMEEAAGRRSSSRWQVVYRAGPDGSFEAVLESGSVSKMGPTDPPAAARPPPPKIGVDSTNAIPIGPRSHRERERERERERDRDRGMMPPPPTGPRGGRAGPGPGPGPGPGQGQGQGPGPGQGPGAGPGVRSSISPLDHVVEKTHSRPPISYQMVSEDLARSRTDNMRSYYTRDRNRDLGREINRYSFENGDSFVDRGKEIFEGIRPPHRDADRRGGGGGGGGRGVRPQGRRGPPSYRQRSDRYLPGASGGSGSGYRPGGGGGGRFRDVDDDRLSRRDDSRDRDYRDRRHR